MLKPDFIALGTIILLIIGFITKHRHIRAVVPLFQGIILSWTDGVQGNIKYSVSLLLLGLVSTVVLARGTNVRYQRGGSGSISTIKVLLVSLIASYLSRGQDLLAVIVLVYVYLTCSGSKVDSFYHWLLGVEVLTVFMAYSCLIAGISPNYILGFAVSKGLLLAIYRKFWLNKFSKYIKSSAHLSLLRG